MVHVPLSSSTQYRLLICLFLLTGLLGVRVVSAPAQQPAPPVDTTESKAPVSTVDSTAPKSPGRAFAYSLGGTTIPVALGVASSSLTPFFLLGTGGLVFGPSFGHFYAEDTRQALVGIGIRAGGLVLPAVLSDGGVTGAVAVSGLAAFGGRVVYDVVTADDSARAYNERHATSVRVTPAVGPRGERVGLSLRVSF